jgi:hypothetical protein
MRLLMKKIHILERGFRKRHPFKKLREYLFRPYWFPLENARKALNEKGYEYIFFNDISPALYDCDILILSSRSVDSIIAEENKYELRAQVCQEAKENVDQLVWFDGRDSAGNCQFDVLPFVDRYLKRALYRDRSAYTKPLFLGREFTDYYNNNYDIDERQEFIDEAYLDCEILNDPSLADKMYAAWGCGAEYHWPIDGKGDLLHYFYRGARMKLSSSQTVEPLHFLMKNVILKSQ